MTTKSTTPKRSYVRHTPKVDPPHFGPPPEEPPAVDMVSHPPHYKSEITCGHCGQPIECIDVIEQMSLLRGTAMKYLWRAGKKANAIEDLYKAIWYIKREATNLEASNSVGNP